MSTPAQRLTQQLDCGDSRDIAAYEQAFYAGFGRATHNRLVRTLWEWDDEARRVRVRLPYADQRIWAVKGDDGAILAAIAVNTALRQLQSAAYGFAVPAELKDAAAAGRVGEFLTFFAVKEHSLTRKLALWRELFADLRALGVCHGLATCSPRVFPLYQWMGARRLAIATIGEEIRYFLQFDLLRTNR